MTKQQKRVLLALGLVSTAYFVLFIFPNQSGARDVNMLSLFEADEYAFYPHIVRMLTPGDSLYQTARNFLIYLQYFYGYPFFFFSGVALLPIKWIVGQGWAEMVPLNMTVLRQMLSVLPMLLAVLIFVYMQTRWRSWWRSLGLLLLLLSMPGLFGNNAFWHPDSLAVLFVALTFFFLDRDQQRYGRNFLLAAAACGLATSAKHTGLFFFVAVPLYLIWGMVARRIDWKRALLLAVLFVVIMVAAVVISNPLLMLPIERAEIIGLQVKNLKQLSEGFIVRVTEPYFQWGDYPSDFRLHYGELLFVLLLLFSLVVGIVRKEKRVLHVLILAFIVPLLISINSTATRRTHYFLPIMLPLMSTVVNLFPQGGWLPEQWRNRAEEQPWLKWLLPGLAGAVVLGQFVIFSVFDAHMYVDFLQREQQSPGIDFFEDVDEEIFAHIPAEEPLAIYRDWRIYVPERPHWRVELRWELASYEVIADIDADVILLERANVALFTQEDIMEQAVDTAGMQDWQTFYSDAAAGEVDGYRQVYSDEFGYALVSEELYEEYLSR